MAVVDLSPFFRFHTNAVADCTFAKRRYLYDEIDWNEKAIMVIGDRGVGKTTLFIQYASSKFKDLDEWLYLSGDFFELANAGLYNTVETYFSQTKGKCIVLDEIHRYLNWKGELKNILDAFRNKQILISGSSSIHLRDGTGKGETKKQRESQTDLQRRHLRYHLRPMSFREYLAFRFTENFDRLELNQITGGEHKFVLDIENRLKSHNIPILAAFEDYLQQGCYPYFLDSPQHYGARLARTIENIIAGDIATALDLNAESIHKLNRLYAMIASSKPFTPNIASLAKDLAATRDTIYRYFSYLEKAGLTRSLRRSASKAGHILTKPDKVCLSNPNLIFISRDPRLHSEWRGSLRESFFVSNFKADEIFLADSGDFIVDDLTFEIGGPGKTGKQVKGIKNAYVVRDGEQFASGHFLPLWIFGFIY